MEESQSFVGLALDDESPERLWAASISFASLINAATWVLELAPFLRMSIKDSPLNIFIFNNGPGRAIPDARNASAILLSSIIRSSLL